MAQAGTKRRDKSRDHATAARNRLLPEGRVAGPMPWVIAIMMFLTVLSAAAGLGLNRAAMALGSDLAGRATVQLVEGDADMRQASVTRIVATIGAIRGVRSVDPVAPDALAEQLRPWLGADMAAGDLPIPALIDIRFETGASVDVLPLVTRALAAVAPQARMEPHAAFLAPLTGLMSSMAWLAALLVLLMSGATGAVVVLAARGAHDNHRITIDILHLMGATDVQIARLFQRRIALDALFGGALGFICAALVILILGQRLGATGSDLLQSISLPLYGWIILLALPAAGVLLATLTARLTVLRALGRQL